jgi:hypothetical protein
MSEETTVQHADGPATRQYVYGLLFIVALMAIGTFVAAFALAQGACACTTPTDLVIVNRSATAAGVEWRAAAGLLGTPLFPVAGQGDAPACQASSWGLDKGAIWVTVTVGGERRTTDVHVPSGRGQPSAWILIDAQGRISDPLGEAPAGAPGDGVDLCP